MASAAIFLVAASCTAPTSYFGIDLPATSEDAQPDPDRQRAIGQRNLIMMIATLNGCYERTDGGFGPVRAAQASSFECAEILSEVENRSAELGLGRGPGGIWALDLSSLASMAQLGDKQAQLELGIRFEEGIGVPQSFRNACKLYRNASARSGGTLWIYSPPVGNGTTGRVIPIDQGPVRPGLSEAAERLAALDSSADC